MSKRLGGIKGCKYKTSSWHLNGFPYDSPMTVTLGQQYNIGEKPTVILLYTYINRHAGTPEQYLVGRYSSSTTRCLKLFSRFSDGRKCTILAKSWPKPRNTHLPTPNAHPPTLGFAPRPPPPPPPTTHRHRRPPLTDTDAHHTNEPNPTTTLPNPTQHNAHPPTQPWLRPPDHDHHYPPPHNTHHSPTPTPTTPTNPTQPNPTQGHVATHLI